METNNDLKTKVQQHRFGNLKCIMQSDSYNGELMDTRVVMETGTLCYIAGTDIDQFLKEINAVIQKYRI